MENLSNIKADINWLTQIIRKRIKDSSFDFSTIAPIKFKQKCVYSDFINDNCKNNEERLLIILVLVPHIYPMFLQDQLNSTYLKTSSISPQTTRYPEHYFAIVKSSTSESYLPTGQTFLYLAGGNDIEKRITNIKNIFEGKFSTITNNVISPVKNSSYDPLLGNIIILNHNYALAFLTNNITIIKNNQLNNEKES